MFFVVVVLNGLEVASDPGTEAVLPFWKVVETLRSVSLV